MGLYGVPFGPYRFLWGFYMSLRGAVGFLWVVMGRCGALWVPIGFLCVSMGCCGVSMGRYGALWGFYGSLWVAMGLTQVVLPAQPQFVLIGYALQVHPMGGRPHRYPIATP